MRETPSIQQYRKVKICWCGQSAGKLVKGINMFNWLRAKFAAKRLGLRDRGPIGREWTSATEYVQEVHRACRTRIRIGITQDKRTVKYCWRCEEMLEHPHHV